MRKGQPAPFLEASPFIVRNLIEGDAVRQPKIEIRKKELYHAFKLAEKGFYGGDPEKILSAPVNIVLDLIRYEGFTHDVQRFYKGLNNEGS
jgi:hypothetical protein